MKPTLLILKTVRPAVIPAKYFLFGSVKREYPPRIKIKTQALIGKKNKKNVCCGLNIAMNVIYAAIADSGPT